MPRADPVSLLDDTLRAVRPPDAAAAAQARERQERLTKPSGSLGVLEDLSVQLAGLAGACPPPLPEPAMVAIFAGDHGVHAQGVTPWPQQVTAQMVANFLASGAVVSAIAAQAGAQVCVVDVGVAADLPAAPRLLARKVRPGTADMTAGPAMSRSQAVRSIEVGIETARELVGDGNRCLLTADMGIANTTASAALIAAFTGADAREVTGRGTGVDDATLQTKIDVVRRALARHQVSPGDPVGALAAVGGLEHAALTGFLLGAAALRVPALLDGVTACAAALAACALAPDVAGCLIAGHLSAEPGARLALAALRLRPLLDLDLRLGEGSGATLALPIVQSAARVLREVATFDSAGVSGSAGKLDSAGVSGSAGVSAAERHAAASDAGTAQLAGSPASSGRRVLVLGGARSGKSLTAERLLADYARVDYIATGQAPDGGDAEWDERVLVHRQRRPAGWRTTETLDVERVLAAGAPVPALVDCLSTWLAGVLDQCGVWADQPGADQALAERVDALVEAWRTTRRQVVAVSNEVGSGIVPGTVSGRRFRDELGRLNARIAAQSQEVWLCTAGIARRLR